MRVHVCSCVCVGGEQVGGGEGGAVERKKDRGGDRKKNSTNPPVEGRVSVKEVLFEKGNMEA